ncbi:MAG TPA: isoprenylcysteine carboxylmethyltransferase family protein [Steroidobacteraceae bacterium]|nr:isoprenylcysteine carboxylmethyltransferase family protein [Steroidobacteraceae bacterium]
MTAAIFSRRFAANYLSTLGFIALAYWIITDVSGFHRSAIGSEWRFAVFGSDRVLHIHTLMHWLIGLYVIALIPFYLRYPWLRSKANVFLQGVGYAFRRSRRPLSRAQRAVRARDPMRLPLRLGLTSTARQAALALLLKFFFAPLMINWCLGHVGDMTNSLAQFWQSVQGGIRGRALFDGSLFWACFQAILFVDTLLFTIGYIVEMPSLKNRIRSVDPTFFGWFVCLACYPPFNSVTGSANVLPWMSNDFPQFEGDTIHFIANGALIVLMAVYSWASVALGFKASNLTNRGIVARGPYAWVRHPAYAAKNMAWWIGAMPMLGMLISTANYSALAAALASLTGWSLLYALRAITEERHLLMADNGYAEYAARIRWRFIPGLV